MTHVDYRLPVCPLSLQIAELRAQVKVVQEENQALHGVNRGLQAEAEAARERERQLHLNLETATEAARECERRAAESLGAAAEAAREREAQAVEAARDREGRLDGKLEVALKELQVGIRGVWNVDLGGVWGSRQGHGAWSPCHGINVRKGREGTQGSALSDGPSSW